MASSVVLYSVLWFPIHLRLLPCSVCLEIILMLGTKVWLVSNRFVVAQSGSRISLIFYPCECRARLSPGSRVRWDEILITKFSQLQPIDTQTSLSLLSGLSSGFSHLARISRHDTRDCDGASSTLARVKYLTNASEGARARVTGHYQD